MKKAYFKVLVLLLFAGVDAYGQNLKVVDFLRKFDLENAKKEILGYPELTRSVVKSQIDHLETSGISDLKLASEDIEDRNLELLAKFYFLLNYGDINLLEYHDRKIEALGSYKKALNIAKYNNNEVLICEALKKILSFHRMNYLYDNETYHSYLDEYSRWIYDDYERANYHYYKLILNFKNYYVERWHKESFKWLSNYFEENDFPYLKAISYNVFASYFEELGDFDKVWYYVNEAEEEFSKIPFAYKKIRENQLFVYAARVSAKQNDAEKLIEYLRKFDSKINNKTNYQFKSLYFFYNSVLDTLKGDYKSAYNNYFKYEVAQDSIRRFKYNDLLNELETKYQTAEKEKQILKEQQRAETNRNWLVVASVILLLGTGITILLQKNALKKRKLAEQVQLIQKQKVETLLKEQELISIDAMIAGQEKERQRVANELHDDLGSLMATVKLHFDNVKVDKKDPALKNAQELLEEAYQKIRGMAHAKNSGVMANQGLVPAVQKMADTLSDTNAIKLTVEDYGMHERLENSLELTIFRILQELMANIIKHAEARTASIQFTQHEDNLNIIVADNGKGFERKVGNENPNGMGLSTIEKRIEHLEGNFTIDSVPGNGTSILIDIPI